MTLCGVMVPTKKDRAAGELIIHGGVNPYAKLTQ